MLTLTGFRSWAVEQLMAICPSSGGVEAGSIGGGRYTSNFNPGGVVA